MTSKKESSGKKVPPGNSPRGSVPPPQGIDKGRVDTGRPGRSSAESISNQGYPSKQSRQPSMSNQMHVNSYDDMPDRLKQLYEGIRSWEIRLKEKEQAFDKLDKENADLKRQKSGLREPVDELQQQVRSLEEHIQNRVESPRVDKQAETGEPPASVSQLESRIAELESTESEWTTRIRQVLAWLADKRPKSPVVEGTPGVGVDESEPSHLASEAADAHPADLSSLFAELQSRLEEAMAFQASMQAKEEDPADRERALQARESAPQPPGESTPPQVDAPDSDAVARDARDEKLEKGKAQENARLKKQFEELKSENAELQKQREELLGKIQRISQAGEKYVEMLRQEGERARRLEEEVQSLNAQVGELRRASARDKDQLNVIQSQKDLACRALEDINRAQDRFREDGLRMAAETRDEFLKAVMAPIYEGVLEAAREAAGRLAQMRLAMQESEARRETASERTARDFLKPVLSGRAAIKIRDFLEAEPCGSERNGQLLQQLVEDLKPFPGTQAHGLLDETRAKEIELVASEGDRFAVVGLLRGAQVSIPEAFKDCYSVPGGGPPAEVYQVKHPGWMVGRAVLLPAILEAVPVS